MPMAPSHHNRNDNLRVFYRKKHLRNALFAIVVLSLLSVLVMAGVFGRIDLGVVSITLLLAWGIGIGVAMMAAKARIEFHARKIKYVNIPAFETPPEGEILIAEIESIRRIDTHTIQVTSRRGAIDDLKTSGLLAHDRSRLESELMQVTAYNQITCLSCQRPMHGDKPGCPHCGWSYEAVDPNR